MRYDYRCDCGRLQEVTCSMADRKDAVPCECGGTASQVFTVPEVFVRFREYQFDPTKIVGNNGKAFGRTAEQQQEGYARYFNGVAKNVRSNNRGLNKRRFDSDGVRYIGGMPGEMADSIGQQEGDPEAVFKDPETFLKKTGLYVGEGEGK